MGKKGRFLLSGEGRQRLKFRQRLLDVDQTGKVPFQHTSRQQGDLSKKWFEIGVTGQKSLSTGSRLLCDVKVEKGKRNE